jgi:hypothetical protein
LGIETLSKKVCDTKLHLPMCLSYIKDVGRVSDFRSFFMDYRRRISSMFFFAEYQIVLSLSYLVFRAFFLLVILVFVSEHRQKEGERKTINRLCHSNISKMMFDNVFIRYLFILLLSVHLTVSQDTSTGMLFAFSNEF